MKNIEIWFEYKHDDWYRADLSCENPKDFIAGVIADGGFWWGKYFVPLHRINGFAVSDKP